MKWKIQFEDEMGIAKKREAIERDGKKLTGRELFMQDQTLNESDLKFLDEGIKNVFYVILVYILLIMLKVMQ